MLALKKVYLDISNANYGFFFYKALLCKFIYIINYS